MVFDWSELGHLLTQAIGGFRLRQRTGRPRRRHKRPPWPVRRGTLVLVGGTLEDEVVIELIHRAGGRRASATVIPAAHLESTRAGERYVRYLTRFGMERVDLVDLNTRQRADDRALTKQLEADIVIIGGGDAALLMNLLAGSLAERSLAAGLARGSIVVLTGDAVAAAGDVSLDWKAPYGAAVRRGLGLLPHCLVDYQAVRRAEMGRLFRAVGGDFLGISLDAGTALFCGPGPQSEVHGRGAALVIDGRQTHGEPAMSGVATHVLPSGWRIDLASHLVLPPPSARAEPSGVTKAH